MQVKTQVPKVQVSVRLPRRHFDVVDMTAGGSSTVPVKMTNKIDIPGQTMLEWTIPIISRILT